MKNVVVIGGGHGSSVILSGLKDKNVDLTAVISMADDGGSTGRLRRELGVSAVGDIRNCLAALSGSEKFSDLFSYRFSDGELEGHSLGNMFLAAGELSFGDVQKSIDFARSALGVSAGILPVTTDKPQLKYNDRGREVTGVYEIAKLKIDQKPALSLEPKAKLSTQASQAIASADMIVIAPGNFYCSIAQALLVDGLAEALEKSPAKVVMVTNLVNIDRHNGGFSPADYALEVDRLLNREVIDRVIYNTKVIGRTDLADGESQVEAEFGQTGGKTVFQAAELVDKNLAQADPNDKIAFIRSKLQHDRQKIAKILLAL